MLLAAVKPASPVLGSPAASSARLGGSSPRIVLHPRERRLPASATVHDDDEGWQTVVSRRTHKELRRLERRPRRPVPADLRGKCFNCFSPGTGRRPALSPQGVSTAGSLATALTTARCGVLLLRQAAHHVWSGGRSPGWLRLRRPWPPPLLPCQPRPGTLLARDGTGGAPASGAEDVTPLLRLLPNSRRARAIPLLRPLARTSAQSMMVACRDVRNG